jgi:protein FAM32A
MPGDFVGGALNFKGEKSRIKKKKRRVKHDLQQSPPPTTTTSFTTTGTETSRNDTTDNIYDGLTDTERKAQRRRLERERMDAEKIAQKSHRERIEEFNTKLASQTELNDIPRVSAAGNG